MVEKVNLTIQDFEDKKSQAGKRYTRFKTEQGWMSAFEADVIESLKKCEGKKVCVGVAVDQDKGFKNIRAFHGEAEAVVEYQAEEAFEKPEVVKIGGSSQKEKEYHLTAEAVRIGALEASIKVTKKLNTDDYTGDLFISFKQFEHWILTGKQVVE